MTPSCLKMGLGDTMPKYSIVALYCDFGDPALTDMAENNIKQLKVVAPDAEIIVVLNQPSDDLTTRVKKIDDIISVTTNTNLGCVVKNLGYELAQGQYVFSLDHDVFVKDSKAFTKCIEYMDRNLRAGILGPCGGNVLREFWTPTSWGVGGYYDGRYIFGYDDPVDFGGNEELDGTPVDTIPSMFWCIRKTTMRDIGLLNWRFGPFVGSDTDYCFRVKMKGYSVNIMRVPILHLDKGGCSHSKQPQLDAIRENHLKALYGTWHPHIHSICENYRKNHKRFRKST